MLTLTACVQNEAVKKRLMSVESIMEEHPDSALSVLRSMDSVAVNQTKETQVLHALLMSQAFDKNFIDVKDDSLISIAVRYYEESEDLHHRMMSHYYRGRVLCNAEKYPQSIVCTFKAYDEAKKLGDHYWIGMTAKHLSNIYSQTYSYTESLDYAKKALSHFQKTNHQKHINWLHWHLAVAYRNCGLWDDCIRTATEGLDSARKHNDQTLVNQLIREIGIANFGKGNYPKSIKAYSKLCTENKDATASDSVYLGLCYHRAGNIDKANEILSSLSNNINAYESWLQYEVSLLQGDSTTAFNALKALNEHTNRLFKVLMVQNISGSVSQYFDSERQIEAAKAENANLRNWILIAISIILFIAVGIIVRHYYCQQRAIIEENVLIAQNLNEIIALKENQHSELQRQVSQLITSHFETLDKLCDKVYETQPLKDNKKHISNLVSRLIADFTEKTDTLESLVNEYCNNAMHNFRQDFPHLKDVDYMVFLYNIFGLSTNAVALLLQEEKKSIYERKRRLKVKIKQSEVPNRENYLALIG